MPVELISPPLEQERVVFTHSKSGDVCEIYLHGATLTSWIAARKERIFLSAKAKLDGSKAIRGGIPLVFPQFATPKEDWAKPLPQHGFARISKFKWLGTKVDNGEEVTGEFGLDETHVSEELRKIWPFKFHFVYTVTLKAGSLSTYITVKNRDDQPWKFTSLLHTYFRIPDITQMSIYGLKGYTYSDKADGYKRKAREGEAITVNGELDAAHEDVTSDEIILDVDHEAGQTGIRILKDGFKDVVTWNPWAELAKGMSDFGDEEYKKMICVEVGTVAHPVELAPGQTFKAGQVLEAI